MGCVDIEPFELATWILPRQAETGAAQVAGKVIIVYDTNTHTTYDRRQDEVEQEGSGNQNNELLS